MKAWTDLDALTTPPRVARLKRDERGYPIPAWAMLDANGKPDFHVLDMAKWVRLAQLRFCGICGEALGRHLAFVGGPKSVERRVFKDLPMHHDCASYALRACPFLAAPKFSFAAVGHQVDGVTTDTSTMVSPERPERFALAIARTMELCLLPDGSPGLIAGEFTHFAWWENGAPVARSDHPPA